MNVFVSLLGIISVASAAAFSVSAQTNSPQLQSQMSSQWRQLATQDDQDRIDKWKEALKLGRDGADADGHASHLAKRAPLFDTDAALPDSNIPAGLYHCSITKLDGDPTGGLPYIAYPAFRCRVVIDNGRRHFTKLTGSQLTIGWIYEAGPRRSIYLGSSIYGYEDSLVSYGKTKERDDAAVVQRIGPKRWRMVFPFPFYESKVDVMELTPVDD